MQTRFTSSVTRYLPLLLIAALLTGLFPGVTFAQQVGPSAMFGDGGWQASYWNNLTLNGAPNLTRTDTDVNFNWGLGSPASEINVDNFSARWTRTLLVTQSGTFRFTLNSDDGSRLFIDDQLVINAWYDHGAARTFSATRQLSAGAHEVRIEYYERRGAAVMRFGWSPVGGSAPITPTVTPPTPPPPPAAAPESQPVSAGQWRGEYFNNRELLGAPALVRGDAQVDFNWGFGSPAPGIIGVDNFSTRWTNTINFPAGLYRFRITVDDGVRVFVNERLVIDAWREQAVATLESSDIQLGGATPIRVEYFEAAGEARVLLTWFQTGGTLPPTPAPPVSEIWTAEYFNNADLAGTPVLVRGEGGAIDYAWGFGSPAPGVVNNDFFSARWNRAVNLAAGTYRFRVLVDDGTRLFVNNRLIIDQWRQQGSTEFSAEIDLPGGAVPVRLEFVEFTGNAQVHLSWEQVGGGGGGSDLPAPTWSEIRPARAYTGEYFANRTLSSSPALVRQDRSIDFDWGNGSPDPAVPTDNFSVRWTNTIRLERGTYRFTTETDDGVRLFINDRLVIDRWRTQSRTRYTHEATLGAGEYTIRMEYFDDSGPAIARLRIEVQREPSGTVGNIITCVPPQPQNYAWIKLYRLDGSNRWYSLGRGIGSINPTGFLKIDGLPVDVSRFGGGGEPYKVEQWIDGRVARSTGDFQRGEPEFRVRSFADNFTPWICPP